jgi:phosphate acyltransferase
MGRMFQYLWVGVNTLRILVDAMGGDHAPVAVVEGSMDAINQAHGFDILLIGDSQRIQKVLDAKKFNNTRLQIVHTGDVITNEDSPTKAIKSKKDSSMVVGFNMLKEKKGDVFLSSGNTGALLAGALFILGRIKGVNRPALAPVLPAKNGSFLLVDAGANTVCRPINYLQFGIMGSIYMSELFNIERPKVGLINVGAEESKGNDTIKQAFSLLSNSNINFTGNVEGKQLPEGHVDVAVCDGFVGNVLLKFLEGAGSFFFNEMKSVFTSSFISKLSALAIKKGLRNFKKRLDPSEYGAVPFLGVNGKVMKSHGSSDAKAIKNAVIKAYDFAKSSVEEKIKEAFENMEVEDIENAN